MQRSTSSIRRKLLLPLVAVSVIVLAGLLVLMVGQSERLLKEELRERASLIAHMINYAAESISRQGELQRIVTAVGAERDVALIVVVAEEPPRVVASTQVPWIGRPLVTLPVEDIGEDLTEALQTSQARYHLHVQERVFDYTAPIRLNSLQGAIPGAVMVHLDVRATEATIRSTALTIGLTLGGVVVVCCGIGILIINRRVLHPLWEIQQYVEQPEEVRANNRAAVFDASDELGGVARVIRDAFAKIERANNDLRNQKLALDEHAIVSVTNIRGQITYANDTFCALSGYPREELLGQDHHIINSKYHPRAFFWEMRREIARGHVWRGAICNQAKDGRIFWTDTTIVPMLGLNGKPEQYVTIRTDITERVAQAERLQQINEDLAKQTAIAQQASAAKGAFLANMSHEIRTPMNGVIGLTSLLLDTSLTKEQRSLAEMIRGAGDSLLALLNDILDFSKIEAGKLVLESVPFDIGEVIEELAGVLSIQAEAKGLELVCAVDARAPLRVVGDPGRVRQILTNMVGNAIKFTSSGAVTVRVSAEPPRSGVLRVRVSVTDTGIGIPPDKVGLLFQSFSQVDASTTRKFGGTGLGLAICKQLAELMGGEVGVESEEGKGSTFWFAIQVKLQDVQPEPCRFVREGVRVLVVDGCAQKAGYVADCVAVWGGVAERAATVEEAEALWGLGRFAAVVVEERVEGADGWVASMSSGRWPPPPVVWVKGMRSARREGVTKPVRRRALWEALAARVDAREEGASAREVTLGAVKREGRVLLAEDNPINQVVARGMLKKLGLSVDVVENGQQAVEALARQPYDLVLMDMQMPEMDGVEATRVVRAGDVPVLWRDIPIIAMTANAMAEDRQRCLDAGMNDFVAKPVVAQRLTEVLDRWLSKEQEPPSMSV